MEADNVSGIGSANHRQNITDNALKSLRLSSNAIDSATGQSENCIKVQEERVCPNVKWYYMVLRSRELKEMQQILSGQKTLPANAMTEDGREYCKFQTFTYTFSSHNKRIGSSTYSKEVFEQRKAETQDAMDALDNNEPIDTGAISGGGFLFVRAELDKIKSALCEIGSRYHLMCDRNNQEIVIPDAQMRDFIIMYESMPWNMEILDCPLWEIKKKKELIRFTDGILKDKVGYIMRVHRDKKVVFEFANMTISIFNFQVFPFVRLEDNKKNYGGKTTD